MEHRRKETALWQSLSLLCARMHMSFFAFRGLLCFGLALAVEGFELFELFRALGEGLGVLEEHGVAEGEEAVLRHCLSSKRKSPTSGWMGMFVRCRRMR